MTHNSANKSETKQYYWYGVSIAIGIFIAFLMFNDIINAILFGVPIGYLLGLTFSAGQTKR